MSLSPVGLGSESRIEDQMDDGVIVVERLSKRFGRVQAVQDLSFTVQPGKVTGFLGPNGAGKTTTLRMILDLVRPTSGYATICGKRYTDLEQPMRVVGAALEAATFNPGRTARNHLLAYAPAVQAKDSRCDEVLELVGLSDAARRRVGTFSMGMRGRLALATTLLGNPRVLVLDEPANGLDPEGIAWLRDLLRFLADSGHTVLISSHMLSEVQQTVDDVVIIASGKLVHASSMDALTSMAHSTLSISSPDAPGLHALAERMGWKISSAHGNRLTLEAVTAAEAGAQAFRAGLELHELAEHRVGLEDVFLSLVASANGAAGAQPPVAAGAQPPAAAHIPGGSQSAPVAREGDDR